MTLFTQNAIKVLGLAAASSFIAVLWCPLLTHYLYKYKFWKKEARTKALTGEDAVVFNALHKEREVKAPRMGGLLIWVSLLLAVFIFWFTPFNFLSRSQTWLPLFTLVAASLVGMVDDVLQVFGKGKYIAGGLSLKKRIIIVCVLGLIGSLWFYEKLGWDVVTIPFLGQVSFGFWYIPLFIIVMVATWSGGVIDGLDGLAGGTFASMFGAFTVIAFAQGKIELAAFCAAVLGALLAFLWFNIPPARFYMGETGIFGLTATLSVVAFLTDSVFVLPIIAGLLVMETGSNIIQVLSKKFRRKKVFLSTPIHHHFEALGWPPEKVTMRFWVIGIVLAIIGTAIRLLS